MWHAFSSRRLFKWDLSSLFEQFFDLSWNIWVVPLNNQVIWRSNDKIAMSLLRWDKFSHNKIPLQMYTIKIFFWYILLLRTSDGYKQIHMLTCWIMKILKFLGVPEKSIFYAKRTFYWVFLIRTNDERTNQVSAKLVG